MSDRPKQMSLNPSTVLFVYFEILVFNLPIYEKRKKNFKNFRSFEKSAIFSRNVFSYQLKELLVYQMLF